MKKKVIKYLIKFSKNNVLEVFFVAIIFIFLCLFSKFKGKNLELLDTTTFSSILIATSLTYFVKLIKHLLLNKIEDSAKLESDFKIIKDKYYLDVLVSSKENPSSDNIIPIIKSAELYGKDIIVIDNKDRQYQPPEFINNNYSKLINAHITSSIYNSSNIRVVDWQLSNDTFTIYTERTTYFNSLTTNRAMDYEISDKLSVRSLFEPGPNISQLKHSKLSNHLGFNGMIESKDNCLLFVKRKNNLSVGKGTYGNSVGASLKTKYALDENGLFNTEGLYNSIKNEIFDEIGINAQLSDIKLITAYRDLLEGGKPQLFFYHKSNLTMDEINRIFSQKIKKNKALNSIQKMQMDGTRIVWIPKNILIDNTMTEVFYNRLETHTLDKHITLPMFPNASACVVFLIDFFKKENINENN